MREFFTAVQRIATIENATDPSDYDQNGEKH